GEVLHRVQRQPLLGRRDLCLLGGAGGGRGVGTGRRGGQARRDRGDRGVQRHGSLLGRGGRGLLSGEDLVDLVLAPALAGDLLERVGHRLAGGLVEGQRLLDGVRLPQGVGERAAVLDGRVRALALVVAPRVGRVAGQDEGVRAPGG